MRSAGEQELRDVKATPPLCEGLRLAGSWGGKGARGGLSSLGPQLEEEAEPRAAKAVSQLSPKVRQPGAWHGAEGWTGSPLCVGRVGRASPAESKASQSLPSLIQGPGGTLAAPAGPRWSLEKGFPCRERPWGCLAPSSTPSAPAPSSPLVTGHQKD